MKIKASLLLQNILSFMLNGLPRFFGLSGKFHEMINYNVNCFN
jgi:hypothetical protein